MYLGGDPHLLDKNGVSFCPTSGSRPNNPPSRKINENCVFSHLSLTTQRKDHQRDMCQSGAREYKRQNIENGCTCNLHPIV